MSLREEWFSKIREGVKNDGVFKFIFDCRLYFGYTIKKDKMALVVTSERDYDLEILDVEIGDHTDDIEIHLIPSELHEMCIGSTMLEAFASKIDRLRDVMTEIMQSSVTTHELNEVIANVFEQKQLPTEVEQLVNNNLQELS